MLNGLCQVIPRGVMGGCDILMYRRCLQLARWKDGARLPVVEAGFPSTLHSCPHVGAFVFFFIFLFFLKHRFPSFSMEGKLKRIICSNNHFSMTAGKGAFKPILIGLSERQIFVPNWWTLRYLMLRDHGIDFAEHIFHFKLCHEFLNCHWTWSKKQLTWKYNFCSQNMFSNTAISNAI